MKSFGKLLIYVGFLFLVISFRDKIFSFAVNQYMKTQKVSLDYKNDYFLSYDYKTVTDVDTFKLENKEDLINLYYTILNRGYETFNFYCPSKYETCINDIIDLINDQDLLSSINGYIHPYNSFDKIDTTYDSIGRVTLSIDRVYSNEEIEKINKKVEEIIEEKVKDYTDERAIIEIIHDYLIDNSTYDKERADFSNIKYDSNKATGVLFEGYGVCSGYTDAMAIFLNHYNIPNFELSSENHVWNVVKLRDKWYHLDLTWDDPVVTNGDSIISHDFFLVDTDTLLSLDKTDHMFETKFYKELAA